MRSHRRPGWLVIVMAMLAAVMASMAWVVAGHFLNEMERARLAEQGIVQGLETDKVFAFLLLTSPFVAVATAALVRHLLRR